MESCKKNTEEVGDLRPKHLGDCSIGECSTLSLLIESDKMRLSGD